MLMGNETVIRGEEYLHQALQREEGQPLITVSNHVGSIDDPLVNAPHVSSICCGKRWLHQAAPFYANNSSVGTGCMHYIFPLNSVTTVTEKEQSSHTFQTADRPRFCQLKDIGMPSCLQKGLKLF